AATDVARIANLAAHGFEPGAPCPTVHRLRFARLPETEAAGQELERMGFELLALEIADGGNAWAVAARRDLALDLGAVAIAREALARLAHGLGGSYAGWLAAAPAGS